MNLAELSLRRPVLCLVASLVLFLLGVVGFRFLGVREYPAVDPPVVTITTNYPGASPDVIDSQITEPLEQAVNGVSGVRNISSTSRDSQSVIRVEFAIGAAVDAAANDIRDKVAGAVRRLPADVDPPIVEKADADASPIVFLTVQSDTKSILEVNQLADTLIKERMQTIPGVSTVRIFGEKRWAMRLSMDAERMAAHQVTPDDVRAALARENVELPAGRVEGSSVEIGLRAVGRLSTPDELNRMVIRQEGGRQVEFRDVGHAELSAENLRTGVKRDGVPMIGVAVVPQPNTNAIEIADEFYRRYEQIKAGVPPEYRVEIGYDFTTYVRRSIREVEEALATAFLLVGAVIFLFLRSFRSTLVPVIAIPVSIVSTFFVMYLAGFTINILTLVALVLAIGLVVDDAIVVLENIYSKVEAGMEPLEAALAGSKEIYFAVISTTITLAAVFLPIVFIEGLTGRLFREFAVVVSGSVLISAFVALTLSPVMCRYLLRRVDRPSLLYRVTEPFFVGLGRLYRRTLQLFLRVRWLAVPIAAGVIAAALFIGKGLKSELAPLEDRSNVRIGVRAPEGTTYEATAAAVDRLAVMLDESVPEISRSYSITALFGGPVNTGIQNLYLLEPNERRRTQEQIFQSVSAKLNGFTDLRTFPAQPPTIGNRFSGLPLQYVVQAPNLDALAEVLPKILEEAGKSPALRFVDADLKFNRPEGVIHIDRAKATELGISVADIARTLDLSYGGRRYGYFVRNGRQYQVIGELERADRSAPDAVRRLSVRSKSGQMVALDNLVRIQEGTAPAAIYRFDRYVSATLSGGLAPGYALDDGIRAMDAVAKAILDPSFHTALAGEARDFSESATSLYFAFGMAILLIYLVLAAQFESFIDPLIILFTVPMSLFGALLGLWLTGNTLNIFSEIGIIMLIGIVTKNGILIVEFANQHQARGLAPLAAVLEAAVSRYRPILMTTLTTVLGVLPIALSLGSASGSRQSLGIAVVAGLAVSTLLTLYVVPAVYAVFSRKRAPQPEPALTVALTPGE
ncbi:MAG: efflux RND transporter permease subunit [Myxococcales bacterium]|nr:efflux RND transporter permease subunit [Myxococcales bacterium]